MMELVSQVLVQVILPLVMVWLVAAGIALLRTIVSRVHDERLREFARELVRAAEQLLEDAPGAEKLRWVEKTAELYGEVPPRPMIEAAVWDVKQEVQAGGTGTREAG